MAPRFALVLMRSDSLHHGLPACAAHDQRHLPYANHGLSNHRPSMSIARATQGLSALETGLQHLCPLASARRVDALLRHQVRAKAGRRTKPSVTIIDSQSVKTISKGAARIRRRQKNQRTQAPYSRRHNGVAAGRGSAFGWHSGPDGSQGFAGEAVHALER